LQLLNAAPGFSYSNFCCLRNGQLYGKALDPGFVGIYGPTQCLGRAGQWVCWPQEEAEGENKKTKETIKTKVEILADMSQEDHVNYV
jgi:hypothetical protein